MKIDTSNVKKETILKLDDVLYRVTDVSHTHMGRQGATYSFKIKAISTNKTKLVTYNAGTILEQAEVNTQNAIFLYQAGDNYTFMENDTGQMHEISAEDIEDVSSYLKENLDVFLMIYQSSVIGVILPMTVNYTITSTVPWVKGNRARSGKKPATIETGLELQIPFHKNEGDTVLVNTQTWEAS